MATVASGKLEVPGAAHGACFIYELRRRIARRILHVKRDDRSAVVCGREDALCPVERHELMHALVPGSRLVIVEEAGHLPTLERPEETTAALSDWLAA